MCLKTSKHSETQNDNQLVGSSCFFPEARPEDPNFTSRSRISHPSTNKNVTEHLSLAIAFFFLTFTNKTKNALVVGFGLG